MIGVLSPPNPGNASAGSANQYRNNPTEASEKAKVDKVEDTNLISTEGTLLRLLFSDAGERLQQTAIEPLREIQRNSTENYYINVATYNTYLATQEAKTIIADARAIGVELDLDQVAQHLLQHNDIPLDQPTEAERKRILPNLVTGYLKEADIEAITNLYIQFKEQGRSTERLGELAFHIGSYRRDEGVHVVGHFPIEPGSERANQAAHAQWIMEQSGGQLAGLDRGFIENALNPELRLASRHSMLDFFESLLETDKEFDAATYVADVSITQAQDERYNEPGRGRTGNRISGLNHEQLGQYLLTQLMGKVW